MDRPPSWLVGGVALGLLLLGTPCRAEDPDPDAAIARGYYLKGKARYTAKDYRGAIDDFRTAFRTKQLPELMYNIGRCHEALGELREAIEAYHRYLDMAGPSPEGDELRHVIGQLEARLLERTQGHPRRAAQLGLGLAVPGAVLAVTGAVFLGVVAARYDACVASVARGERCAANERGIEQGLDVSGKTLLGVGGAAVVGGVVGYLVLRRRDRGGPRAGLSPSGSGLSAWGAF